MTLGRSRPAPWLLALLLSSASLTRGQEGTSSDELRARVLAQRSALEGVRAIARSSPIAWRDGHSGEVLWASISPDGERVVTYGTDGAVLLWDAWLGTLIAELDVHSERNVVVAFGPEGETVLVRDGPARTAGLWDGRTGDRLFRLDDGGELVVGADFLSAAEVVTADTEGVLRRWDARSGQLLGRAATGLVLTHVQARSEGSGAPLLAGGEGGLLSRGTDSVARVLDPRTGEVARVLDVAPAATLSVGILGDGRAATMEDDGATRVWPPAGGEPLVFPGEPGPFLTDGFELTCSDDPPRLVTWSGSGLVLWDVRRLAPIARLVEPGGGFLFSDADAARIVAATTWWTVRSWSTLDGAVQGRFRSDSPVRWLGLFPDGRLLACNAQGAFVLGGGPKVVALMSHAPDVRGLDVGDDGRVFTGLLGVRPLPSGEGPWTPATPPFAPCSARFWDRRTGTSRSTVDLAGRRTFEARFLGDGRTLLTVGGGGTRVLDPSLETLHVLGDAKGIAVRPQEDRVALSRSGADSGDVELWKVEGERPLRTFGGLAQVGLQRDAPVPVFQPVDGSLLVTAHDDSSLRVWDGFDGEPVAELVGHASNTRHLAFSPDGEVLLSSSLDRTARLWDMRRFEPLHVLPGHGGTVWYGAFRPDGSQVATASLDGVARIWDVRTGELRHTLRGHARGVRWIGYHPDGDLLLTCSDDGTARLWNADSGAQEAVLEGHVAPVREAAFADGGTRILTRGGDASTRVWETSSGRLLLTHVEYAERGWLSFTPEGYYVAGGAAEEWARIRDGRDSYPLSSYAVILRRPEKVAASLRGEALDAPVLHRAPRLTLAVERSGAVRERQIHVLGSVEGRDGIEGIELVLGGRYPDGSEVEPRRLPDEQVRAGLREQESRGHILLDLHVPFPEGWSEVSLGVRATSVRGIRSQVASLHRRYEPPPEVAASRLFLVALGVQDYDDDRLDLGYARKDVEDVVACLRDHAAGLFDEVRVETRLDGQVNRAELNRLRHEFLYEAGPEDTIVVYVAGHGVLLRGEYYLLTSGDTPSRPYGGLTKEDLLKLVQWEGLESRRRLMLIDTCHAGERYGESRDRGVSVQDAFSKDELREAVGEGLYIVTASTEEEAAREVEGNGLFTRVVLEALRGAADDDGDGYVDTAELIAYATKHVEGQRPTTPLVEGGVPFRLTKVQDE